MSKHRIRASGKRPEQWEWTCDYCGKHALTNSQATRPPGWFPRGRTIGMAHDFCSAEHEEAYKAEQAGSAEAQGKADGEKAPATEEAGKDETSS
jgi:hypothetical protein